MKLTSKDKEILIGFGYEEKDLDQIEMATLSKYTSYKLDNKKISLKTVLELLDREAYLSGIGRSAFHWSSARETKDGRVIYFDSSKLFK